MWAVLRPVSGLNARVGGSGAGWAGSRRSVDPGCALWIFGVRSALFGVRVCSAVRPAWLFRKSGWFGCFSCVWMTMYIPVRVFVCFLCYYIALHFVVLLCIVLHQCIVPMARRPTAEGSLVLMSGTHSIRPGPVTRSYSVRV